MTVFVIICEVVGTLLILVRFVVGLIFHIHDVKGGTAPQIKNKHVLCSISKLSTP